MKVYFPQVCTYFFIMSFGLSDFSYKIYLTKINGMFILLFFLYIPDNLYDMLSFRREHPIENRIMTHCNTF